MRRQTYGHLPSRRASPPLGRYQIILLGDRGTWVWTTCPELLSNKFIPPRIHKTWPPPISWFQGGHFAQEGDGGIGDGRTGEGQRKMWEGRKGEGWGWKGEGTGEGRGSILAVESNGINFHYAAHHGFHKDFYSCTVRLKLCKLFYIFDITHRSHPPAPLWWTLC